MGFYIILETEEISRLGGLFLRVLTILIQLIKFKLKGIDRITIMQQKYEGVDLNSSSKGF